MGSLGFFYEEIISIKLNKPLTPCSFMLKIIKVLAVLCLDKLLLQNGKNNHKKTYRVEKQEQ